MVVMRSEGTGSRVLSDGDLNCNSSVGEDKMIGKDSKNNNSLAKDRKLLRRVRRQRQRRRATKTALTSSSPSLTAATATLPPPSATKAEFRRLKTVLPSIAGKDKVSRLDIILEAIKYIDDLQVIEAAYYFNSNLAYFNFALLYLSRTS